MLQLTFNKISYLSFLKVNQNWTSLRFLTKNCSPVKILKQNVSPTFIEPLLGYIVSNNCVHIYNWLFNIENCPPSFDERLLLHQLLLLAVSVTVPTGPHGNLVLYISPENGVPSAYHSLLVHCWLFMSTCVHLHRLHLHFAVATC